METQTDTADTQAEPSKEKPPIPQWMEVFRNNLRATRRHLRVSQRELAERTGLFPQGISNIENGHRPQISFSTAATLAKGLGVSLDFLMGRKKPARPKPGDAERIPGLDEIDPCEPSQPETTNEQAT